MGCRCHSAGQGLFLTSVNSMVLVLAWALRLVLIKGCRQTRSPQLEHCILTGQAHHTGPLLALRLLLGGRVTFARVSLAKASHMFTPTDMGGGGQETPHLLSFFVKPWANDSAGRREDNPTPPPTPVIGRRAHLLVTFLSGPHLRAQPGTPTSRHSARFSSDPASCQCAPGGRGSRRWPKSST